MSKKEKQATNHTIFHRYYLDSLGDRHRFGLMTDMQIQDEIHRLTSKQYYSLHFQDKVYLK